MDDLIKLDKVIYDKRSRNGEWCMHPYQNHPKGCPNFPKCPKKYPDFNEICNKYNWYAVIEVFDLQSHAKYMKEKHPDWTERQCRNPLYWQGSVRKRLYEKCKKYDYLLDIPEASGVNVFETMKEVGIHLERTPNIVRKVMMIGRCSI